ncbi:MAG: hypothetical protein R3D65_02690 [Zhengella sp.]|nr:hypothetical protein [Brucellaceae bacterium]
MRALAMQRHRLADQRDVNGILRQADKRETISKRMTRPNRRPDNGQRSR